MRSVLVNEIRPENVRNVPRGLINRFDPSIGSALTISSRVPITRVSRISRFAGYRLIFARALHTRYRAIVDIDKTKARLDI